MSQPVVIKSNKYGINLILDSQMSFEELLMSIIEKFHESAKFFKNAKVAISFSGRTLSTEESYRIVNAIMTYTDIQILCIMDETPEQTSLYKQQIDTFYDAIAGKEAEIYRGSLRSGQVLEKDSTIVIVGDVAAGARILSKENVIVLGTLQGAAYAGIDGNENRFVAALDMEPSEMGIGEVTFENTEKKKKTRKILHREKAPVMAEPQMARVIEGEIHIEPIRKGMLS